MGKARDELAEMFMPPKPDNDSKGIFLKTGLYSAIPIPDTDHKFMTKTRSADVQFDCYCVWCERSSTFAYVGARGSGTGLAPDWALQRGTFFIELSCLRDNFHKYQYIMFFDGINLTKIGQHPSLEDIASQDIARFISVLPKPFMSDLRRAGGLFSHGIGIGSFVYLRRIFEKLISDAHAEATNEGIDLSTYEASRMAEKIALLAGYLPAVLVKNRSIYGILSKGIHELDENDCLRYFPVIKAGIIQILEEHLQQKQRQQAEADLEREVQRIASEIKNSNSN